MNQTRTNNGAGPEKVFGKAIRISVWRNTGQNGSFISLRLERRFKDKNGEWQSSNSLTVPQALRMHALLGKAIAEYLEQAGDATEDAVEN